MKALSCKLVNGVIDNEINPKGQSYIDCDLVLCYDNKKLILDAKIIETIEQYDLYAYIVAIGFYGDRLNIEHRSMADVNHLESNEP